MTTLAEINMNEEEKSYEQGLRDGRIISLEATVRELTKDVKMQGRALFLLYGGIALIQFVFPYVEEVIKNGQ